MSNLKEEMAKLRDRQDKKQEKLSKGPEWPLCAAHGCMMQSSYKGGSAPLCTYHGGQDVHNWTAITNAIKEHKGLINKFAQLTYASSNYWSDPMKIAAMKGWPVLPMQESETSTGYLIRFGEFVRKTIYQTATENMGG